MAPKIVVPQVGQTFRHLTVIAGKPRKQSRAFAWPCQCVCGKIVYLQVCVLRHRTSCGCMKNVIHGHNRTGKQSRLHRIWNDMKNRCSLKKSDPAGRYLARGIKVCERWCSFPNFLQDILAEIGEPPTPGHQIDRKDNDGNYEPGNVRWATREEQQRNTRRTHFITFRGKTQCLTDWALELGIPRPRLSRRIHLGWSLERALTTDCSSSWPSQ